MDKIAESGISRLIIPKGIDPNEFMKAKTQKATMNVQITEHGSVIAHCPYCILYYREKVVIDVTKFVEQDGLKEHTTYCVKRDHKVVFQTTQQWREKRQKMGLQIRS